MNKEVVTVRLDPKMIAILERYRDKTGDSISSFIRTAIARELVVKGLIEL